MRDVEGNMGKAACGECVMEGVQRERVRGVFQGVCTEGSVWREKDDTRKLMRESM